MTNNLAKLTDNTIMIQALKIAREFDLTTKAEAEELIHIYETHKGVPIANVLEQYKGTIRAYEGLLRVKASRGEQEPSVERSIGMWKQDVAQIEKAICMVTLPTNIN